MDIYSFLLILRYIEGYWEILRYWDILRYIKKLEYYDIGILRYWIDNDRYWYILMDIDWCWLMLIDVDRCW